MDEARRAWFRYFGRVILPLFVAFAACAFAATHSKGSVHSVTMVLGIAAWLALVVAIVYAYYRHVGPLRRRRSL
jgi:hypothetical protein